MLPSASFSPSRHRRSEGRSSPPGAARSPSQPRSSRPTRLAPQSRTEGLGIKKSNVKTHIHTDLPAVTVILRSDPSQSTASISWTRQSAGHHKPFLSWHVPAGSPWDRCRADGHRQISWQRACSAPPENRDPNSLKQQKPMLAFKCSTEETWGAANRSKTNQNLHDGKTGKVTVYTSMEMSLRIS